MVIYEGCRVEGSDELSDGINDVDIDGYLSPSTDALCVDGCLGTC